MRRGMMALAALAAFALPWCLLRGGEEPPGAAPGTLPGAAPVKGDTSNQLLMRDKLLHAQEILRGVTLEDYSAIAEHARKLGMISRAASWHVLGTPEYSRHSKNFQEIAADLERHAKERNLDAAAMDNLRLTMTCVECHKHVRASKAAQLPPAADRLPGSPR